MKKLMIPIIGVPAILLVTLVSMANLNVVNLLITGSDYGAEGTTNMFQHKDDDPDGERRYLKYGVEGDAAMETLQSGLLGSAGGSQGLNLLWLLQNAKDPDKSTYAYQLLEGYAKLENGSYNDLPYHAPSGAIAGLHFNETKLQSLITPRSGIYAKPGSGSLLGNGVTLENAMRSTVLGAAKVGHAWIDNGGDGIPDGPFQIEKASGQANAANKNRAGGTYDPYNFADNLNTLDIRYNEIAGGFLSQGVVLEQRVVSAGFGITHNRGGGATALLYGIPYQASGMGLSNTLKVTAMEKLDAKEINIALSFPKDLMKWFDATNIPLEQVTGSNGKGRGLALLLTVANGGFIDKTVGFQTERDIKELGDAAIGRMFPGQTRGTIAKHLNDNHIKKPWDVLGMSKSSFDKVYGTGRISSNYEEVYRSDKGVNTAFYIDKSVKSSNYRAGENVVVRAIEGIAGGYMFDVGILGDVYLMHIALEAGIKTLTDGTTLDMTDPTTFYQKLPEDSFNPASAADGNFGLFLDGLGLTGTLTEPQQAQIKAMYEISGGPYSQSRRGQRTADGRVYADCSYFVSVGLHMGDVKQVWTPNPQTSNIQNGAWMTSKNKTAEVNGKTYDAKVRQLDKNGKVMAASTKFDLGQSRKDNEWLGYLKAGDMVNGVGRNGGHIYAYLGQNNTNKNMVLTQDVSKVNPGASVYKPGQHFTIQATYAANRTFAGGKGSSGGKMGLSALWADSSGAAYQAMRPVYNLD